MVVLAFAGRLSVQLAALEADAPSRVQLKVTPVDGAVQLAVRFTDPPLLGRLALVVPLMLATHPVGDPAGAAAGGTTTVSGVDGIVTQAVLTQIET